MDEFIELVGKKNIIIFCIVIILIVLTVYGGVKLYEYYDIKSQEEAFQDQTRKADESITKIESKSTTTAIKKSVDRFLDAYSTQNNEIVYNMLDKKYVKEYNITEDNSIQNFGKIIKDSEYTIEKVYTTDLTINIYMYFVYGSISTNNEKLNLFIYVDQSQGTFSISPMGYTNEEYIEYRSDVPVITNRDKLEFEDEIEMNVSNYYEYIIMEE